MHKYASMAKSADAKDLKSFGSDPISVQIRLLAPKEMRECFKNFSLFCFSLSFGTYLAQKTAVLGAFMHNYECSVFTYKKIWDIASLIL